MRLGLARRGHSSTGGAEAYLKRFAAALELAGHPPVLFTSMDWPEADWDYELHQLEKAETPWRFAVALANWNPRSWCDYLFSLERVLACDCFRAGDGVHAAWLRRRAQTEPFWKPLFRRLQRKHRELLFLERTLLAEGGAGRVIVNSKMVAQEIVVEYGYPRHRISLVYNGVPPPLMPGEQARARSEVRRELSLKEDAYIALFAGSGWERKGLRNAIRAVERARSAPVLLVAGEGKRSQMPASTRVRYLGGTPGLDRVLAAADVFVLPTLYDPFSNACLEAMAAGLPVITTEANGFAEILGPDEGEVLRAPARVADLAAALDRWADPDRRRSIAERVRVKAADFTVERNVAETLAALESA